MTDQKKTKPRSIDAAEDLLEDADRATGLENKSVHFPESMLPASMRPRQKETKENAVANDLADVDSLPSRMSFSTKDYPELKPLDPKK